MKKDQSSVVLVFNDRKELALQLRAAIDDLYPLHWDFSAAGGIFPGEDHKNAAIRELKEEIGIESDMTFDGEELFQNKECTDRMYIYKTTHNGPFQRQVNEVEDIQFFTLEKIGKMILLGEKFHPEFLFVWNEGIIEQAQK